MEPHKISGVTAGFARLSRYVQDQTSTERQLADERKLVDLRQWPPLREYVDVDTSAYKRGVRRPAYEQMLADIQSGEISHVVMWKIDRIARNLPEFMRFQKICDDHNVTVASVNDPYDTSSPIGRAIVQILAVFAELESATISLRVRSAKNMAATKGGVAGGGPRPFGYTPDRTALVAEEAAAIRAAADRMLAGESMGTICREWNRAGLLRSGGKQWTVAVFSRLMPSPHLAGLRVHRGEVVGDATWPAILDRDVHEALVALSRSRTRPVPRRSYLLTGLLACGKCGGMLRAHVNHGQKAYRCPPGPGEGGCGGLSIMAEPVDIYVEQTVLDALSLPSVRRVLAHPKNGVGGDTQVLADLHSKEEQLRAYAEQAHIMSPRSYAAATAALERDIEVLERKAAKAAEDSRVLVVGADPAAEWQKRDLTWRAALVAALFETPVVVGAGRGSAESRVRLVPRP